MKKNINSDKYKYELINSTPINNNFIEKSNIYLLTTLIDYSNQKKKYDIVFLNTNYPIFNIIFVCNEILDLLKNNGLFIYNNYDFSSYSLKVDIDIFIKLQKNILNTEVIDSLIILKKNNELKHFHKNDKNIYDLIENSKLESFSCVFPSTVKRKLHFDLSITNKKPNQLLLNSLLVEKLNKLKKKYLKIVRKSLEDKIKMKLLDTQVFSRNRPVIKKEFNLFFENFYKSTIDPIRFHNFYKFLELNLQYSRIKKDYMKYEIISDLEIPKKDNILYLHTYHSMSRKFKKKQVPYIEMDTFSKYTKSNKNINKFNELIKKNPKIVEDTYDEESFEYHVKKMKNLKKFKQILHLLNYEYTNSNNNYVISTPSPKLTFDLKSSSNLNKIQYQKKHLKIKQFDIMKIDLNHYQIGKIDEEPKSIYYVQSFFNIIVFVLENLIKNGSVCIYGFGCFDEIYIQIIEILRNYFDHVELKYYHYNFKEKIDLDYGVICQKFRGITKKELDEFKSIMNEMYAINNSIGRNVDKPIYYDSILSKKCINKKECVLNKDSIIKFNNDIFNNAIDKYHYYLELYQYFFGSKKSKNINSLKKVLLNKQMNSYILLLDKIKLLDYREFYTLNK